VLEKKEGNGMGIGRNSPCPCGSLKKYKKCCKGKVEWEKLGNVADGLPYLSARGRNLVFLNALAGILGLDTLDTSKGIKGFKDAFTPDRVRLIFQAVGDIWANPAWVKDALTAEASNNSALYTGTYDPERVFNGIGRVSLYSDTILLPDPFPHPRFIRSQYNPLDVPEQYLGTALRWSTLWLTLAPWIEAGIVRFVRTLGDLDPALELKLIAAQRKKYESEPRLKDAMDRFVKDNAQIFDSYKKSIMLSMPDQMAIQAFKNLRKGNVTDEEVKMFLNGLQQMRDNDPYYVDPKNEKGEQVPALMHVSSGANIEEAKLMANLSGSHLLTDMEPRWIEIALDREAGQIDDGGWSAFSQAFQDLPFKYLRNVPLGTALRLRQEGRLEGLRSFLRRSWNAAVPEQQPSRSAVENLAAELQEKINEAEAEWDKIDRDLLKWFGSTSAVGALVGPAIGVGAAGWGAAAIGVALAGMTELAVAHGLRDSYAKRYPAAFFLSLQKQLKD
jgi:hypothetical protein